MNYIRRIRYYYIKFTRIKGNPHELALGMAFGIFAGMLPIVPFHMILSIALALFFKGSKITAAIGTWISNPLDWVFIYYFNYKIGSVILGLSEKNNTFLSIMQHIRHGEEGIDVILDLISSGSTIIGAFLVGGLIMGIVAGIPSYFIFLNIFRYIQRYKENRKDNKNTRIQNGGKQANAKTE